MMNEFYFRKFFTFINLVSEKMSFESHVVSLDKSERFFIMQHVCLDLNERVDPAADLRIFETHVDSGARSITADR